MSFKGRTNAYTCDVCRARIVTVDRDDGVTPMTTPHRYAEPDTDCDGLLYSSWYKVPQDLTPSHEWYRPDASEYEGLDVVSRQHCDDGGLLLRRIEDEAAGP